MEPLLSLTEKYFSELRNTKGTSVGLDSLDPIKYNNEIKKGEITVEEAVNDFIKNPVTKPYWHNISYLTQKV